MWFDTPQDRAYSIPQDGYISKREKWQGRQNINSPASYLQTAQALKIV
jgi:hypothetical protein